MFWLAYLILLAIALFGYGQLLAIAFRYERAKNDWPEGAAWQHFLSMPRPKSRWHYLTVTLKEAAVTQGRVIAWKAGMACIRIAFFGMIVVGSLYFLSALLSM